MASGVESLDLSVVRPFVGHIERASNGTAIWVSPMVLKDLFIYTPIDVIDGVVESY